MQVICFSKDRPLQLHGYLTSLFHSYHGNLSVSVLARIDAPYTEAYAAVESEFPKATFVREKSFADDLDGILSDVRDNFLAFGCDDALFVCPVTEESVEDAFDSYPIMGLSMRLGVNITRNMFFGDVPSPIFTGKAGIITWDILDSTLDWNYPWELDGTIYPSDFAKAVIRYCRPTSPNLLEYAGSTIWQTFTEKTRMAAFVRQRLIVPTINRVQEDFQNPVLGLPITTTHLLDCWNAGFRMDLQRFHDQPYNCVHVPNFYLTRATHG